MIVLVYLVVLAAAVVFVTGCAVRIVMYAKTPLHLRWELYPVPHEGPGRAGYGGSRFEESDWWTKPSRINLAGEVRAMVPEILFLKGLYEFNRGLWLRSFPFHTGIYLLAGSLGLIGAGAVLSLVVPAAEIAACLTAIRWVYSAAGSLGLFLGIVGALGLLVRRLTDENLKNYSVPADFFNLLFFLATFGIVSAAWLTEPSSGPDMLAVARGVLTLDPTLRVSGLLAAGLILAAVLVAYIPFTHMSHFIAKYFTYHSVRWDDIPNAEGGKFASRLAECLAYRPTWAAAHIGADGIKSWAQVAAAKPDAETRK